MAVEICRIRLYTQVRHINQNLELDLDLDLQLHRR
jgi:hypothetical protein